MDFSKYDKILVYLPREKAGPFLLRCFIGENFLKFCRQFSVSHRLTFMKGFQSKNKKGGFTMIYKNIAKCDLRQLSTAEEFSKIEKFESIATLILPKGLSVEAQSALAAIPRANIAKEIYLEQDAELRTVNGSAVINRNTVAKDSSKVYYTVNGSAVVCDLEQGTEVNFLVVNGSLIIQKNLQAVLNVGTVNGSTNKVDFEDFKFYPDTLKVDGNFIREIPNDTLIIVGDSITFEGDVTVDDMREKNVRFSAGDSIKAPKELLGYLKANSYVGDEFVEKREKFRLFRRRK